jgi:threonyl-tRNA synthetase
VYGITFPDKKQLAEHLERLAEAKKRDHRNVGTQMELFMFDKLSPGSCFFMPNGACIYNALVEVRCVDMHASGSVKLSSHEGNVLMQVNTKGQDVADQLLL